MTKSTKNTKTPKGQKRAVSSKAGAAKPSKRGRTEAKTGLERTVGGDPELAAELLEAIRDGRLTGAAVEEHIRHLGVKRIDMTALARVDPEKGIELFRAIRASRLGSSGLTLQERVAKHGIEPMNDLTALALGTPELAQDLLDSVREGREASRRAGRRRR